MTFLQHHIYLFSMMLSRTEFAVIIKLLNNVLCMFAFIKLQSSICKNINRKHKINRYKVSKKQ